MTQKLKALDMQISVIRLRKLEKEIDDREASAERLRELEKEKQREKQKEKANWQGLLTQMQKNNADFPDDLERGLSFRMTWMNSYLVKAEWIASEREGVPDQHASNRDEEDP